MGKRNRQRAPRAAGLRSCLWCSRAAMPLPGCVACERCWRRLLVKLHNASELRRRSPGWPRWFVEPGFLWPARDDVLRATELVET